MQRYHFQLNEPDGLLTDEEGIDLLDTDTALREARRQIREMVAQEVRETGELRLDRRLEVSGEDGNVIAPVAFNTVITIRC